MTGPSAAMDSVPKPGGIPTGKERYIKGAALGEGTFGVVTKAEDTVTHKIVAIKKIRLGKYKEGVNFTAIREIKLLQELRHPHVIELVDCFPHKRNLNLVFECCESDLEAVIKDKFLPLGTPEIKSYMQMTLRAVAYCHDTWVLHRDLKPSNLLLNANCDLKICDFGLARTSSERGFMTEYVVTRWYRAPELLLSCEDYTSAIDIWSMGCILAEILGRKPLFPGKDYIHQMRLIVEVLGSPNEEDCAFIQSTKARTYIRTLPHSPQVRWDRMFPKGNPQAIDLLDKMLQFDPKKRITVEQALEHPYLAALHDPMVELASEPAPFEFEFEDEELQEEQLREKVWEEMLSFHGESSFGKGGGSGVTPMMS